MGTLDAKGHSQLPLAAALGHLYVARSTGRLRVFDSAAGGEPFMEFWFKYGVPCFSASRDQSNRLGALLPPRKKSVVDHMVEKAATQPHAPLLGQMLLAESVVTAEELNRALVEQLCRRILTCAAMSRARFQFEAGYDLFGGVPLSSPPVSPLELAARCCLLAPMESVESYLVKKIRSERVALVKDRRVPASVRDLLSSQALDAVATGVATSQVRETPSMARTLCFLASFGFLEAVQSMQPKAVPKASSAPVRPRVNRPSLESLDKATNHYALLGLPLDATASEVRRAYRDLALVMHPDRVTPAEKCLAQRLFSRLVEAHETLGKESRRLRYDEDLVASGEWRAVGTTEAVRRCLDARAAALQTSGATMEAGRYSALSHMVGGASQSARWAFAYAWA